MKEGLVCAAAFLAAFLLSAGLKLAYKPGKTVHWTEAMGSVHADLPYGEGDANRFDLYLPAERGRSSYGLVVYLHAGGFTSGDKRDDEDILKRFCAMGYVAAGVNYTLRTAENEASVYTQSLEIRSSIPAIVEAAGRLGYPVQEMAIAGGSAGGCLALLYAYRDAQEAPVPVRLVFEMVGPASFCHADWKPYGLDRSPEAAAGLFSIMSGRDITPAMIEANDYAEAVRDISAADWVSESSPPTLCAYGTYDKICPFDCALPLRAALEANGVPHDFIVFPHSGHGLQNDDRQYVQLMEKLDAYLSRYMPVRR